ncbi:YAP1-binding protein 1 [Ceratocystis pirilliformis]|uniref:YAP1-binding protein 1 n=1 Tax=Ceratocystis pirilliformis TaxID=259994 RepID=A0ABR3Z4V6_9PEZI
MINNNPPAVPIDETAAAVERLLESRPPATDTFTYLTIIEKSLCPEILPTLLEILQDAAICQDIGWDLVDKLLIMPGSADCLQTIARLGNPREVIIKVLESLERLGDGSLEKIHDSEDNDDGNYSEEASAEIRSIDEKTNRDKTNAHFSVFLGMLGILHKRLDVRSPSRFLHSSLATVCKVYSSNPSPRATAAIIDLVYALQPGATRPPLPNRQSSTVLAQAFPTAKGRVTAPDPEADTPAVNKQANDRVEEELKSRLLRTFVSCVIEAYVNGNDMAWAARLNEYYVPEKIVPGRRTWMQAFKEDPELVARDGQIGQLVSLAADLGLTELNVDQVKDLCESPLQIFPLRSEPDPQDPEAIKLSSGGMICLSAYWTFASEVFDATYKTPDLYIFPEHYKLLGRFLATDADACISANPGTLEALIVIGLYLESNKKVTAAKITTKPNFMEYLHLVTLVSVFHPSLLVRNAATVLAGAILHADPDDVDRLKILEDLLENCIFSSLQAQAVTWLREELQVGLPHAIERAEMPLSPVKPASSRFSSTEALDTLQYVLFPRLEYLKGMTDAELLDCWTQNYPLHLQAVNLAVLMFGTKENETSLYSVLVPLTMPEAVEQRYLLPLGEAARKVMALGKEKNLVELEVQASLLLDRLDKVHV